MKKKFNNNEIRILFNIVGPSYFIELAQYDELKDCILPGRKNELQETMAGYKAFYLPIFTKLCESFNDDEIEDMKSMISGLGNEKLYRVRKGMLRSMFLKDANTFLIENTNK